MQIHLKMLTEEAKQGDLLQMALILSWALDGYTLLGKICTLIWTSNNIFQDMEQPDFSEYETNFWEIFPQ